MKSLNIIAIIAFTFLLSSCDKDKNYPKDSILGTWRCVEQGSVTNYRQYNVSIDYQGTDSSMITIYNLYNLGFQVETYGSVQDTIITIIGTNTMDDFSGTGHIERDYSAIHWQYSYFGQTTDPQIEATFFRP